MLVAFGSEWVATRQDTHLHGCPGLIDRLCRPVRSLLPAGLTRGVPLILDLLGHTVERAAWWNGKILVGGLRAAMMMTMTF